MCAERVGFDFACGRRPFAALTPHWGVIHYRSVRIPHFISPTQKHPTRGCFYVGGAGGIRTHVTLPSN